VLASGSKTPMKSQSFRRARSPSALARTAS
jgi:hypothetical protein